MKQRYYIFLLFVAMLSYSGYAQKSILASESADADA